MAKGPPSKYLSCSCSGHLVNLLLGCTSGLNLAADLGPVLCLVLMAIVERRTSWADQPRIVLMQRLFVMSQEDLNSW